MKLCLLLLLLLVSQPASIMVSIDSSGVAEARLKVSISEGLNEVKLPAEPIPETIEVTVDNRSLIPLYENGSLYFFSPAPGEAEITYLVNISSRDGVFYFELTGEELIKLLLAPQIILLTIPEEIENLTYLDDSLQIEFYAPEEIEYVVRRGVETQTQVQATTRPETTIPMIVATEETTTTSVEEATRTETGTTATTTTTISPSTKTKAITEIEQKTTPLNYGLIAFIAGSALAIAIIGFIIYRTKRAPKTIGEQEYRLSELDYTILALIRDNGGDMLQGKLQSELGIPKTTLWRHVKKLEKLGYLRIVKEGAFNRLILIRDIE
ncbi:MAG: winged helix-turn-helix transcriptional regulator [Thaumarchaeota archaeon]|nr:winged helix-turn-helix transcriptional regulator [Nitrososphaerota archaeon]